MAGGRPEAPDPGSLLSQAVSPSSESGGSEAGFNVYFDPQKEPLHENMKHSSIVLSHICVCVSLSPESQVESPFTPRWVSRKQERRARKPSVFGGGHVGSFSTGVVKRKKIYIYIYIYKGTL